VRKFLPLVLALVIMAPLSLVSSVVNAQGEPLSVTTNAATDVTCTSADLSASILANCPCVRSALSWDVYFEYGTTSGYYGKKTNTQTISVNTFSDSLTGLTSCTIYYARAVVTCTINALPYTFYGNEITINTKLSGCCLVVETGDPTGITCTSATLTGTITGGQGGPVGGYSCQCYDVYFEWGTTPNNWTNQTPTQQLCRPYTTFTASLALMPCVTYYVRAVAVCSDPIKLIEGSLIDAERRYGEGTIYYGEPVAFNTMFCCTSKTSSGGGTGWELTSTRPYLPPMFDIPSATVSATKAAPGEQVEVTATITNKGGSNGTTKVILYVNGQEADSKGIALASGQSTPVSFKVSRNDPGTYQVHINSVPAGSFTVDLFNSNDMLIYGSVALFAIGLIGLLYYLYKRRTTA